jgi:hypothetical protein
MFVMIRRRLKGRTSVDVQTPSAWPSASLENETFQATRRVFGGFELTPVNLELMSEAEREATLENLAALYDAIPWPFQLLSVPTGRSPVEHLDAIRLVVDELGERVFRPYAANYHEISTGPTRPPRRTVLLVETTAEAELARTLDLIRRVAEERGFDVRRLDGTSIATLWAGLARAGATYRIRAGFAEGPELVAALHLGRRWPAEIATGWLAGLLGVDGLAAVSMRVRPLTRAEAMTFMTTRLRVVRASDRLAAERGEGLAFAQSTLTSSTRSTVRNRSTPGLRRRRL